jgi:hypothetical protein
MSAPYLLLGFVVLPLWIAAGLADYLCHRVTHIEQNAGTPESFLHLVQYALVGIPVTLGLLLRANAGFFLFAALAILLHHAVAYIDVRYADRARGIPPREQMVHSFLELLPITAFLLLAVAEWPQFLSLLGLGSEPAVFVPEPRLIAPRYTAAVLAAAFLFNFLPYTEELMRCLRASSNKR